jgi:hypothetical protein
MTIEIPKRRGRPTKEMVAARHAARMNVSVRTDDEVLEDLKLRFDMLSKLVKGSVEGSVRALVVSGAPGVGKSFTAENILAPLGEEKATSVKGTLSALGLYKLAYRYRRPGNVIMLDDADGIFTDEDALNVLKALCDTSEYRRVFWMKESQALKEDDIPQSYDFHGSFIFVSNINFQHFVDIGGNKFAAHFSALMSRALYMDLAMHDRRAVNLWVEHIAREGKMFRREGVTVEVGEEILDFLRLNRDELRELSLRTVMKATSLVKTHPVDWKKMARVLLLR